MGKYVAPRRTQSEIDEAVLDGDVEEMVLDANNSNNDNEEKNKIQDSIPPHIAHSLLFDPTNRSSLPHYEDSIQICREYSTSILSLPPHIQFSGMAQCTLINFHETPDMFTATGAIGPATLTSGIDDARLIIGEHACNMIIYNLTGMTCVFLVYDIRHVQHEVLRCSVDVRNAIRAAQMDMAAAIAHHIAVVLGVQHIEGPKFGFSCGRNANWTLSEAEQCTGRGTLDVLNRIGALPVTNITYPRDDRLGTEAAIVRYALEKFKALERAGAFEGRLNPVVAEYIEEMELALEALHVTGKL
jgi:hypothetical protein